MLLFFHVLSSALWLGTAVTLPFWGNRANRADHLHTVLNIIDTVFVLKCVFIMAGLMSTIITGFMLMSARGYPFELSLIPSWLLWSEIIVGVIFVNSWVIFYFLYIGRKGERTLMRLVPPIGYSNIGLIVLVLLLMTWRPFGQTLATLLFTWIGIIVLANAVNITVKMRRAYKIRTMPPQSFAERYFALLNAERMTDLLKLFHDECEFYDPFATGPVKGILKIEQFFQKLGDQFDNIKIFPRKVEGSPESLLINWEAQGTTTNGEPMPSLTGTNKMTRKKGKIIRVDIDFDTSQLPQVQLVSV